MFTSVVYVLRCVNKYTNPITNPTTNPTTNPITNLITGHKIYVGKSKAKNISARLAKHFDPNERASGWTSMYQPVELIDIKLGDGNIEHITTLQYMDKHGIDNVRGGPYVLPVLEMEQTKEIQRLIWSNNDKCVGCGSSGHFISSCPVKKTNKRSAF